MNPPALIGVYHNCDNIFLYQTTLVKELIRIFGPLIAIIVFLNVYHESSEGMLSVGNYPIWMKDASGNRTDQTSGMTYAGSENGYKTFVACDDIGKINRIRVNENVNPPALEITEIKYSAEVQTLFDKFKKVDMEDIYYDSANSKIYLSIEGHEYSSYDPEIYKNKEGVYELTYNKDILTFDSVLTIRRLKLPKEVYRYTFDNVSFEGIALTEKYLYLGLENLQDSADTFTDSTMIYIIDRKTKELVKTINTREEKISTICGLYAVDDYNLIGVDRNTRRMFYITFDEEFNIINTDLEEMDLMIPGHKDINKILGIAVESVTMDEDGNIYCSTDPWKDFYKPDLTERKRLSQEELNNFLENVPIMYKFKKAVKK